MQQCSAIELCLYFSWVRGSISPEALVVFMVASFVIPRWLSWPVKLLETRTSSNKLMCITQQCHFKTQHVQKVNRVDSILKTSQELRTLSRSLSDCQSQTLNVRVKVSQFVRNSQLYISLNCSQCLCLCQKGHMCLRQLCSALKAMNLKRQSWTDLVTDNVTYRAKIPFLIS